VKEKKEKRFLVKLFGRMVWIRAWVFKCPYSCNESGKWPLGIKFYKWGVIFHHGDIADAHVELTRA